MSRRFKDGRGSSPLSAKQVAAIEKVRRVERFLRRGYTNQTEISLATGISQPDVSRYIRFIYDRWRKVAPEEYETKILNRIRQLEGIMQEAYLSFDKSKRGEETQSWITKPCSACAGAEDVGTKPDAACRECDGTGKVTTAHSAIKDGCGDPAYLKVAESCVKQCAYLETLILNGGQARPRKIEFSGAVGIIGLTVPASMVGVAAEKLLEARALLQQLAMVDAGNGNTVDAAFVRRDAPKGE